VFIAERTLCWFNIAACNGRVSRPGEAAVAGLFIVMDFVVL